MNQRIRHDPTNPPLDLVRRRDKPKLPDQPLIGQIIGLRYEIESDLGKGNVGIVYRAKDTTNGKQVAIKFMEDSSLTTIDTFLKEANYLRRLDHPNILKCLDAGIHNQNGKKMYYIVTEILSGETLDNLLENNGKPFRWERIRKGMEEIARTLDYMHKQGIVHRDIKPNNIFVVNEKGRETFKIVDFGTARLIDEEHETGRSVVGTAYYVSPERARGQKATPSSDQYSFGITMYELLTTTMAIGEEVNEKDAKIAGEKILGKQQTDTPKKPRELESGTHIPKDVQDIIMRCLEKKEQDRFEDMEEVADLIGGSRKSSYTHAELEKPKAAKTKIGIVLAAVAIIISVAATCAVALKIKDPKLFNRYIRNETIQNLESTIHLSPE